MARRRPEPHAGAPDALGRADAGGAPSGLTAAPASVTTRTSLPLHLIRGRRAEAVAARYLRSAGLVPLACNFRCRWGELDLVMQDGRCLVVVEVRYLARVTRATPVETVDAAKRRRLVLATRIFLQRFRRGLPALANVPVRFDVVGITGVGDGLEITWVRNAFTLDDVAGA